jgi:hypothetical protein
MRIEYLFSLSKRFYRKKLVATSLLETIVASTIFMIIFMISIDALTNLMAYDNKKSNYIFIENDLKKCRRKIEREGINETLQEWEYTYDWGVIKVSATLYRENIYLINMSSETGTAQSIEYHFLYAN